MTTVCMLYMPVIHQGYIDFIRSCGGDATVLIFAPQHLKELGSEFDYISKKDALRAVDHEKLVASLQMFVENKVYSIKDVRTYAVMEQVTHIVMPDEDVMRVYAERYRSISVEFKFCGLRYDRRALQESENKRAADFESMQLGPTETGFMQQAFDAAARSLDWWRQVGGVVVKEGHVVLVACNVHVPDPHMPNVFGDWRSLFKSGQMIEVTTAEHAESVLVATAAARGISLKGTALYLTTFPCAPCAKLVARSGITDLYFVEGSYGIGSTDALQYNSVRVHRVDWKTPVCIGA
jgi:dCMP deaminase